MLEEFVTFPRVQEIPRLLYDREYRAIIEPISRLALVDYVGLAKIRWHAQNRVFQVFPPLWCPPSAGFFTHLQFVRPATHLKLLFNLLLYSPPSKLE